MTSIQWCRRSSASTFPAAKTRNIKGYPLLLRIRVRPLELLYHTQEPANYLLQIQRYIDDLTNKKKENMKEQNEKKEKEKNLCKPDMQWWTCPDTRCRRGRRASLFHFLRGHVGAPEAGIRNRRVKRAGARGVGKHWRMSPKQRRVFFSSDARGRPCSDEKTNKGKTAPRSSGERVERESQVALGWGRARRWPETGNLFAPSSARAAR